MKSMKQFLPLFFSIIILGAAAITVDAGFSTETISEETQMNIDVCLLTTEPDKKSIKCFDVNSQGFVALGTADGDMKNICVYNSDGDFEYGYSFCIYGDFGVEWSENSIMLYIVRGGILLEIDESGTIIRTAKIQNTKDNNSYWNNSVYSKSRTINETKYELKNDMGLLNNVASSYSQLVMTKPTGEECIVYDVNTFQLATTLWIILGVFAAIGLSSYFLRNEIRKSRQKYSSSNSLKRL